MSEASFRFPKVGIRRRRFSRPKASSSVTASVRRGEFVVSSTTAFPDAASVTAMRRGDRNAFAQLVYTHQTTVYGFLRARLLDAADAEDLCQEVFLRCLSGKARMRQAGGVGPWLIGVARNVLREHVRKVRRRREVAWTELCLELDRLTLPEDGEEDDALKHLPECMESLGESAKEALDLRYQQNMPLASIGRELDRTEGAVKLLMYRARQALRLCLDRKLDRRIDD